MGRNRRGVDVKRVVLSAKVDGATKSQFQALAALCGMTPSAMLSQMIDKVILLAKNHSSVETVPTAKREG